MSQLAERWARIGHRVTLITWAKIDTDVYKVAAGIDRVGLDLMYPSRGRFQAAIANWKRTRSLHNAIAKAAPDVVISFCDQMNIVTLQACRGLNVPVVISEHSDPSKQRLSRLWEFWRGRTYPKAHRCVVLTEGIASYLGRYIASDRLRVIPPAINPPLLDNEVARQRSILFVGRLSQEKGVDLLLKAWQQVQPLLPDWSLQIAGSGPMEDSLRQLAATLPRVEFLGWVQNAWPLYQQSSILVLPSRYEGFPVALIEGLSQGIAAVTTQSSDAIQLFERQHAVRSVAVEDAQALADGLLEVASNERLRIDLGNAGRTAAAQFSWDRIGRRWDQLLEDGL